MRTSAGDEVKARLVIACDGRDSRFRANLLAAPALARGVDDGEALDSLLPKLQARRIRPVRLAQAMQKPMQDAVIAPLLSDSAKLDKPPLAVQLLDKMPLLRGLPARLVGMGFRPEHVRSLDAYPAG